MGQSASKGAEIRCPDVGRQVAFHQLLTGARKTWLADALADAVATIDPRELRNQLTQYAPSDACKILAAAAIREERVFPIPAVLEVKPTLVGYYRLLAGVPQKSFYAGDTGMGRFKSMESSGLLNNRQRPHLPAFCRAMCASLGQLVVQLSPQITPQDVGELPLLTLGAQFQGANNNKIGQTATKNVFLVIAELLEAAIVERTDQKLVIRNASGNRAIIELGTDPDVKVQLVLGSKRANKLAIEIKGGTDRSNAHNRAGEAEKSHQKAKGHDFREFWTLITMKGLDPDALRRESTTTNSWFDVAQVLAREGPDWEEFSHRLADVVGVRIPPKDGLPRRK